MRYKLVLTNKSLHIGEADATCRECVLYRANNERCDSDKRILLRSQIGDCTPKGTHDTLYHYIKIDPSLNTNVKVL